MKNILLFSFLSLFIMSCSGDDDGGGVTIDQNDYFPVTTNAVWFYDYDQTNQGNFVSGNTITDINGSTNIDGEPYQILDNTTYLVGAMNQLFFKKNLNKEVTIRPMVDFFGEFVDFGDLSFIKNSMQTGAEIGVVEKEVVGDPMPIPANESNITGTVTPHTFITITNKHIGKSNNMSVNGQSYSSINQQQLVFQIRMILDINATVQAGGETVVLDREHEFIALQNYGELSLFMAKDVGIIKSDYTYSLNNINLTTEINLGGISLDIGDFAPEVMNINNAMNMQGNASITDFAL